VNLTYDYAGNLIDNGEGKTYDWDAASRLVAVNDTATNHRSEFTYDGLSRRVKIVEKAGSTVTSTKLFVWVGNTLAQERNASNKIARHYFAEGEYREKGYYYTRDHLGSIRELTNAEGTLAARYDYDSYGNRTKLSGTTDVDFGYTGHYHHAPSGLILTLYRAYNSGMGRWISTDPIGEEGGVNLYQYSGNDPVNRIDPLGLQSPGPAPTPDLPPFPLAPPSRTCVVGERYTAKFKQPRFEPEFIAIMPTRPYFLFSFVNWYDCEQDYVCEGLTNCASAGGGRWVKNGPTRCRMRRGGWF
jgi:RHS repeat-associated protein